MTTKEGVSSLSPTRVDKDDSRVFDEENGLTSESSEDRQFDDGKNKQEETTNDSKNLEGKDKKELKKTNSKLSFTKKAKKESIKSPKVERNKILKEMPKSTSEDSTISQHVGRDWLRSLRSLSSKKEKKDKEKEKDKKSPKGKKTEEKKEDDRKTEKTAVEAKEKESKEEKERGDEKEEKRKVTLVGDEQVEEKRRLRRPDGAPLRIAHTSSAPILESERSSLRRNSVGSRNDRSNLHIRFDMSSADEAKKDLSRSPRQRIKSMDESHSSVLANDPDRVSFASHNAAVRGAPKTNRASLTLSLTQPTSAQEALANNNWVQSLPHRFGQGKEIISTSRRELQRRQSWTDVSLSFHSLDVSEMIKTLRVKELHNQELWIIPPDLSLKIFCYLDFVDVCHAAQTCTLWKKLTNNLLLWNSLLKEAEKKLAVGIDEGDDQYLFADIGNGNQYGSLNLEEEGKNGKLLKLTLSDLVIRLTPGVGVPDEIELSTFLITYKTFTTPAKLVRKLIQRFQVPERTDIPPEEYESWKRKNVRPVQLRVIKILKALVDGRYDDMTPQIISSIKIFVRWLICQRDALAPALLKSIENAGQQHVKSPPLKPTSSLSAIHWRDRNIRKGTVSASYQNLSGDEELEKIPSRVLAEQLTLIEFDYFTEVVIEEFTNKTKTEKQLERMVNHFNDLSRWTMQVILDAEKVKQRAKIMEKFIKVAHYCRVLNNFETCMAIISALNDTVLHRLVWTKSELSQRAEQLLEEMLELFSNLKGWANFREVLREATLPCIPFIGVYKHDLVYHDELAKTAVSTDGTINFGQKKQMFNILREIKEMQSFPYDIPIILSLNAKLRVLPSLPNNMDHETHKKEVLYELSLKREPKGALRANIL